MQWSNGAEGPEYAIREEVTRDLHAEIKGIRGINCIIYRDLAVNRTITFARIYTDKKPDAYRGPGSNL